MGVYLRAKIEVSSIILTSYRQGERGGGRVILLLPATSKRASKKPTYIRAKEHFFCRTPLSSYLEVCQLIGE